LFAVTLHELQVANSVNRTQCSTTSAKVLMQLRDEMYIDITSFLPIAWLKCYYV